jgi:hypothetical protein
MITNSYNSAMPRKAKKTDLSEVITPYEDKWVALSSDQTTVVSSGDTLKEVESHLDPQQLSAVIFMRVPPFDKLFIPLFA